MTTFAEFETVLIESIPGYSSRPPQQRGAKAVEEAIASNSNLILQAGTGVGKALDVDTPILTTDGFVRMGDLQVGMKVFGQDGLPATIVHAFDVQYDRPCYRVVFSDGSEIVADADHQWLTSTRRARISEQRAKVYDANRKSDLHDQRHLRVLPRVVSTEEIRSTLTVEVAGKEMANHSIRVAKPIQMPAADLPIMPYVLGAWLGDGTACQSEITCFDEEIIENIEACGYEVVGRSTPGKYGLRFVPRNDGKGGSRGVLARLGVLNNKHIPAAYLMAAEWQRRELLAGLLDTDGTVSLNGGVEITLTNRRLIEDVKVLVASLGYRPTLREGRASLKGVDKGPKYTVGFTTDREVFSLARKNVLLKERLSNFSLARNEWRSVVDIVPVASRPVRCISVDNESHLYLAGKTLIPTHNSLMGLVPAILSGKRTVVATATKALQSQLVNKDLPSLQPYMEFTWAMLQGRSNYFCTQRALLVRDEEPMVASLLSQTQEEGFAGLRDSFREVIPQSVWTKVCSDTEDCGELSCKSLGGDFALIARQRAAEADVVVVNQALLFMDLMSKQEFDFTMLGDYEVVVIDELHEAESYARNALGSNLSHGSVISLLSQIRSFARKNDITLDDRPVVEASEWLFRALNSQMESSTLLLTPQVFDQTLSEWESMAKTLADLSRAMKGRHSSLRWVLLTKRASRLASKFAQVITAPSDEMVRWVSLEGKDNHVTINAQPLFVQEFLRPLFSSTVIGMSATAMVGGKFDFIADRLGFTNYKGLDVGTMFDYPNQAMFYVPRGFPEPAGRTRTEWEIMVPNRILDLLHASNGRALVLFTSFAAMKRAYEAIAPHVEWTCLMQGQDTVPNLVKQFTEDTYSVLFATRSFMTGVSVEGESLSLVILDKLVFTSPEEPVFAAESAVLEAKGRKPFFDLSLPQMMLTTEQAAGRLIRTVNDRGVFACLDSRLLSKSYGKQVIKSLPPMTFTTELNDVKKFLA